jgi:hypothetical protein
MKIYAAQTTGSLQLPIFSPDPQITASGNIWYSNQGGGVIKYAVTSGSLVITKTLLAV